MDVGCPNCGFVMVRVVTAADKKVADEPPAEPEVPTCPGFGKAYDRTSETCQKCHQWMDCLKKTHPEEFAGAVPPGGALPEGDV